MTKDTKCFYEVGRLYSITIAPNDKHQFVRKPDRLKKYKNLIYEETMNYRKYGIDYALWTEISEPKNINNGIGPRVHSHGIIRFRHNNGILNWLTVLCSRLSRIGIIDIDTIKDNKTWYNYCTKQQHIINIGVISNYLDPQEIFKKEQVRDGDKGVSTVGDESKKMNKKKQ